MFCYAIKIVYIFITIFFFFPFFFVVSFFDWTEQDTHFYGTPHDELRTPVKGQWNGRVHTGLCWAGKYALLWHVNGTGGTQLEPLGQVFISAFCFIRHATPPPAPKCASCCLPLWLLMLCCAVPGRAWSALGCAPAHSTQTRRQKPAYMDNLFFRSKFLCPNDYWADFFQPSKPLFASRTSWNSQNLGIVCFFSLSCGREIV